jgi:hypothetical protein
VQAMGAGELKSVDQLRDVVRASFAPITFEPKSSQAWEDAYGRIRDAARPA